MQGLRLSLVLASIVTPLSLLVGVPAAYALAKEKVSGAGVLKAFLLAPLLLPRLCWAWRY
jgi:putative spermidine/putrescine transport system permease protein